jgi:1,2-dihydroxy-3-keto-5-methylthiopentene dioxygenase
VARLTIFAEDARMLSDAGDLAELQPSGATLRNWNVLDTVGLGPDDVLAAYHEDVTRVCAEEGYVLVDVKQVRPGDGGQARQVFLTEHTHDDDEVRYFAAGSGVFYLHVADRVYAVLCEPGDLLSVPKGTAHWFDMGTIPDFTVIRFFREPEGWIGDFTGDPIAQRIPDFDALSARAGQDSCWRR